MSCHDALLEWKTLREWLEKGRPALERRDDVEDVRAHVGEGGAQTGGRIAKRGDPRLLARCRGVEPERREALSRRREGAGAAKSMAKKNGGVGLILAMVSFLAILIPNAASSAREQDAAKRALIRDTNRTNATMAAGSVLSYLRSLGDAVHRVAEDENLALALEPGREDQLDEILQQSYALFEDPSQGLKTDDRSPIYLLFVLDTNGVAISYSMAQFDPRFLELKWGCYLYRDYFRGAEALALRNQHQTYISSGFKSTMNEYYQFAISGPLRESPGVEGCPGRRSRHEIEELGSLDMEERTTSPCWRPPRIPPA